MSVAKNKRKLNKLIEQSDSEDDEHELSYYVNDRIKLMKQVLRIIKTKKIKSMAPRCLKNLDIEEINSMLLEELLGISTKRLVRIINGQNNVDDDSSSSDGEEKNTDIISLDDISDDDFLIENDDIKSKKKRCVHHQKNKTVKKAIKSENPEVKLEIKEPNLMSVLELLELQARARAIKSQLLLENSKENEKIDNATVVNKDDSEDDDAVIVDTGVDEIIISSSDSETEVKTTSDANNEIDRSCSDPVVSQQTNKTSESNENLISNAKEKLDQDLNSSNKNDIVERNEVSAVDTTLNKKESDDCIVILNVDDQDFEDLK